LRRKSRARRHRAAAEVVGVARDGERQWIQAPWKSPTTVSRWEKRWCRRCLRNTHTQKTVGTLTTGGVGKMVELHVQAIQMLPDIESNYAQNHLRVVSYNDYYQFTLKNVASGESFNHLVSNGISNLKAVLIIPLLNTLNNNVNLFDDGQPQLLAHINNFNVLVGGSNVLHADARYTYQSFYNEFFNEFGVNGNQSSGMGSNLIDYKAWFKKPYYYVNCSRDPMEQQNAYRSLQIKGTNSSSLAVDYMIFAVYEKNFSLDVISGNINKID